MAKHMRSRSGPRRPGETPARTDEARDARRPAPPHRPASLEAEIRLRAYYRYLEREAESGDEVSDWLEAESDVLGRHATGADADEKIRDNGD